MAYQEALIEFENQKKILQSEMVEEIITFMGISFRAGSKSLLDKKTRTFSDETNNLRNNTGSLLDSFREKKFRKVITNKSLPDGTNLNWNNNQMTGNITSPIFWAWVHEKGAFIKSKTRLSMGMGLMKIFKETGNIFWKIIALSAIKKGGINIPARPFFYQGIDKFKKETKIFNNAIDSIIRAFNR